METIVFLDRSTCRVEFRKPDFAHTWVEYPRTTPAEVLSRLKGATMVITNKVRLEEPLLGHVSSLKVIALTATGVDNVDLETCRQRGIAVCNVPGYTRHSVPEHVLMLMLALRRNLMAMDQAIRRGDWEKSPIAPILDYPLEDLQGATLGLIGYGQIAQEVERLAKTFGMNVLIAERKGAACLRPGRRDFKEVLFSSDILSLHCPLTPETRNLIGAPELASMKRNAFLINTARGALVDEKALATALLSGQIAGAGLDVLSQEPPPADHPLLRLKLPNLILTAHVAWASRQAVQVLAEEVIRNLEAFAAGQSRNRVV